MELNAAIEHTLLRHDAGRDKIVKLCNEAIEHNFLGVCVPPYYVNTARKIFDDQKVTTKLVTVVGFPYGYSKTPAKVEEIKQALWDGADEIDAVINIAALKSADYTTVERDISAMVTACHLQNKKSKIILETGLLSEEEILRLCEMAKAAETDFVKTSTGITPTGATVEAVKLLVANLPKKIQVKASGGIKTREQALALLEAGATRIGTSNGVKMVS